MRIESVKNYNGVHTWTGILAGLLLYIGFVAGALTMFQGSLNQWALQDEASLPDIPHESYDALIQQVVHSHPGTRKNMMVYLPSAMPQPAPVTWTVEDPETHAITHWQASLDENGKLLTATHSVSEIGEFLDQLHRTAGIPGELGHESIGVLVMGLAAGLYFVALISGLIIFLPTWFKDFLSLRKGRNRKRYWLDFHNVLGISALPFHIVIALTTFVFAFHDPIYGSMRAWIYDETPLFNGPPAGEANRDLSTLAGVDELERSVKRLQPDYRPAELRLSRLESASPIVMMGGHVDGHPTRGAEYTYALGDPYNAEFTLVHMLPNHSDGFGKIVSSIFSLHFGSFGGIAVRWVYFVLGITGALLFVTGNILWIESRRKRQKKQGGLAIQTRSSRIMAQLTSGVCLGTLIGIAAAFLTVKWLPHQQLDIAYWQKLAYYSGFLLSVAWALLLKPLRATQHLLLITIALVGMIPLSTLITANASSLIPGQYGVEITALAIAAGLVAVYRRIYIRGRELEPDSVWAL